MRKNIDMLHGPIMGKILLFALPLAATAILQQLFNVADIAVVGQFVGKEAMAAVGSNSATINLIINLFNGIALGSNVVIAQAIGKGEKKNIGKVVHTSILFAVIAGLAMTALGEIFAPHILTATRVPADVMQMASSYLRIYLLGMPVIFLYNFESAIFRAKGDTRTPLIALVISGVVNVGLNVFLVLVCHMNVEGVAIATVTANVISSAILFVLLLRADGLIRIRFREFRMDFFLLKRILQIGVPSGAQASMFSLANIIIQSAINSLGATVMAGSSAAFNLEIMGNYMIYSFGQAATTFVGQNYGAGNFKRCRQIYFRTLLLNYIFTGALCGLILLFGRQLLGLFNPDPDVIEVGYERLHIIFFAYIMHTFQETGSGYLRGFGKSLPPALNSLICIVGIRFLYMFTVFRLFPTFRTIMYVYPISLWTAGFSILVMLLILRPSKRYQHRQTVDR